MTTSQDLKITMPHEVLAAIEEVMHKGRVSGSMTVKFTNGAVVGIQTTIYQKFKRNPLPALAGEIDQQSRPSPPDRHREEWPQIDIPQQVFIAYEDLLRGAPLFLSKPLVGSLTFHFRNGGVAGIEAEVKKVYRAGKP